MLTSPYVALWNGTVRTLAWALASWFHPHRHHLVEADESNTPDLISAPAFSELDIPRVNSHASGFDLVLSSGILDHMHFFNLKGVGLNVSRTLEYKGAIVN